jgi:ATP-dependent DNA helicase Q1
MCVTYNLGGGKSLCYQLPALISPGITLVVSPLLSLIRDQAFHLEEASIGVGMLTSNTTKEESKRIMEAMLGPRATKKSNSAQPPTSTSGEDERSPLKLVYVTPEKISKSKQFKNQLEKVYANGRLSRIVVDECHCCSSLGHDFRPDYKVGFMGR